MTKPDILELADRGASIRAIAPREPGADRALIEDCPRLERIARGVFAVL